MVVQHEWEHDSNQVHKMVAKFNFYGSVSLQARSTICPSYLAILSLKIPKLGIHHEPTYCWATHS